ncbi:ATP-dependent helicase [Paraburkholderia aromaticivorans]|uniref:ATP-dependent helicase n=1 Tax=Paraburkholderia aromaticivorans TaxID=2026199 RepID=UPI0014562027|nr:ATP-dependent helicase [Paraburkholderia aromaticivorans]
MLDGLNPRQREVVETRTSCLAVACPGAGKTKTIATKAAVLLQEPRLIVGAVTFSKDAAVELRERILDLAGEGAKKRLIGGTFHSLAYKQLAGASQGRKPDIAKEGDRFWMVERVVNELGIDLKVEDAIQAIEKIKNDFCRTVPGQPEAELYAAYQAALMRNGKIDFQDMIRLAVEGMESGTITPYPFSHLLVDEFQDTDVSQYRWVIAHAKAGSIVTVVGDDDQSIYGFRAALGYRGMDDFSDELRAKRIVLGSNYRCRSEILGAADRLIKKNEDRIEKVLVAEKGRGGTVLVYRCDDDYAEATAASAFLKPRLGANQTCAVLARTNRHLDAVEAVVRSHGIKYYRASGKSVLERPESALFCNLLENIQGAKLTGLDSVLGFGGMSTHDLTALHNDMGPVLKTRTKAELVAFGIHDDTATSYRAFMKRLGEWKDLYKRHCHGLVLAGAVEWMLAASKNDQATRAIQATHAVLSRLTGSFSDRINYLRQDNNDPTPDALVLTTMHSSKGLEWDNVWIIRSEEGVCPDDKSSVSEERRLFYVAMTRAREALVITSTKKGVSSRFVQEAELETATLEPA